MTTSYDAQHEVPRSRPEVRDDPDHPEYPDGHDRVDEREEPRYHRDPQPVGVEHATAADVGLDRRTVVARQRAIYGGIKVGSAFFGWLTATGMAVLLTALVAGIGVAVGLGIDTNADQVADRINGNAATVSLAGVVVLALILFVSYYCGGYVAGRMARFNGARQGFAVWLWAVVMAVVVAVVVAVGADQYNVLVDLNNFPRIPVDEGDLTTAGVVVAIVLALSSLAGAVLGGIAGMRFHRKVDRAGLN